MCATDYLFFLGVAKNNSGASFLPEDGILHVILHYLRVDSDEYKSAIQKIRSKKGHPV